MQPSGRQFSKHSVLNPEAIALRTPAPGTPPGREASPHAGSANGDSPVRTVRPSEWRVTSPTLLLQGGTDAELDSRSGSLQPAPPPAGNPTVTTANPRLRTLSSRALSGRYLGDALAARPKTSRVSPPASILTNDRGEADAAGDARGQRAPREEQSVGASSVMDSAFPSPSAAAAEAAAAADPWAALRAQCLAAYGSGDGDGGSLEEVLTASGGGGGGAGGSDVDWQDGGGEPSPFTTLRTIESFPRRNLAHSFTAVTAGLAPSSPLHQRRAMAGPLPSPGEAQHIRFPAGPNSAHGPDVVDGGEAVAATALSVPLGASPPTSRPPFLRSRSASAASHSATVAAAAEVIAATDTASAAPGDLASPSTVLLPRPPPGTVNAPPPSPPAVEAHAGGDCRGPERRPVPHAGSSSSAGGGGVAALAPVGSPATPVPPSTISVGNLRRSISGRRLYTSSAEEAVGDSGSGAAEAAAATGPVTDVDVFTTKPVYSDSGAAFGGLRLMSEGGGIAPAMHASAGGIAATPVPSSTGGAVSILDLAGQLPTRRRRLSADGLNRHANKYSSTAAGAAAGRASDSGVPATPPPTAVTAAVSKSLPGASGGASPIGHRAPHISALACERAPWTQSAGGTAAAPPGPASNARARPASPPIAALPVTSPNPAKAMEVMRSYRSFRMSLSSFAASALAPTAEPTGGGGSRGGAATATPPPGSSTPAPRMSAPGSIRIPRTEPVPFLERLSATNSSRSLGSGGGAGSAGGGGVLVWGRSHSCRQSGSAGGGFSSSGGFRLRDGACSMDGSGRDGGGVPWYEEEEEEQESEVDGGAEVHGGGAHSGGIGVFHRPRAVSVPGGGGGSGSGGGQSDDPAAVAMAAAAAAMLRGARRSARQLLPRGGGGVPLAWLAIEEGCEREDGGVEAEGDGQAAGGGCGGGVFTHRARDSSLRHLRRGGEGRGGREEEQDQEEEEEGFGFGLHVIDLHQTC